MIEQTKVYIPIIDLVFCRQGLYHFHLGSGGERREGVLNATGVIFKVKSDLLFIRPYSRDLMIFRRKSRADATVSGTRWAQS